MLIRASAICAASSRKSDSVPSDLPSDKRTMCFRLDSFALSISYASSVASFIFVVPPVGRSLLTAEMSALWLDVRSEI